MGKRLAVKPYLGKGVCTTSVEVKSCCIPYLSSRGKAAQAQASVKKAMRKRVVV